MKLANNVSGMVNDTLNSNGSLHLNELTANWSVLEGITVLNLFIMTYFVASFFRYVLKSKALCTATNSRSIGQTNLFRIATLIFCLCLPSMVCTQIFMIISKTSASETATESSNLCKNLSNVRNYTNGLIFVLMYAFMWYYQQLIYKRSAMKHLRTRPKVVVSYITIALIVSSIVIIYIISNVHLSHSRSVYGCTYKSLLLSGSATGVILITAVTTHGLMGIGLFVYPLCTEKSNEIQPPDEGLPKPVVPKVLKRYKLILLVFVVMNVVLSVTTVWILKNDLVYESLVITDTSITLQSVVVIMCLYEWRKILMWRAV